MTPAPNESNREPAPQAAAPDSAGEAGHGDDLATDGTSTISRQITAQGLRTRGALLRAARRVFERKGYHNTRIADITAEAKASVGTYYTYFDSKEEVFRHLLVDIENEVYGELTTHVLHDRSPQARIRETNRLYFEAYQRNARFWAVVEESALFNEGSRRVLAERRAYYRAKTARALRAWDDQGLLGPEIDLEFAATALGAMTERCACLWFIYDEPVDLERAVDQITVLWLHALGLPIASAGTSPSA
jgi:AcrR family transcriptional regulator